MKLFPQGRALWLQETRMKRFEEALTGWQNSRLSQSEAALLLGVCERTFRRQIARYEADGLEGLLDRRISQAHVGSMRSPSRGRVRLKSTNPREHPSILFNYMASPQDWQEFRDAIRITREIMAQPALNPYRGREINPSADCQTDAQLDAFVRQHAETAFHPSCTCKMGEDEMSVVDGQGRVHGLDGLRVIDASIMPQIITGNLNATTIMLAEKLADVIRGHPPLEAANVPYFVAGDRPVRQQI